MPKFMVQAYLEYPVYFEMEADSADDVDRKLMEDWTQYVEERSLNIHDLILDNSDLDIQPMEEDDA